MVHGQAAIRLDLCALHLSPNIDVTIFENSDSMAEPTPEMNDLARQINYYCSTQRQVGYGQAQR